MNYIDERYVCSDLSVSTARNITVKRFEINVYQWFGRVQGKYANMYNQIVKDYYFTKKSEIKGFLKTVFKNAPQF